jgi:hypothetical protein
VCRRHHFAEREGDAVATPSLLAERRASFPGRYREVCTLPSHRCIREVTHGTVVVPSGIILADRVTSAAAGGLGRPFRLDLPPPARHQTILLARTLGNLGLNSFAGPRQQPSDNVMNDDEYLAQGKAANAAQRAARGDSRLFALLDQEEGFEELLSVPFALKHVRDLHVVMRHAVAEAGDLREDLTHHPLFHPGFAGFVLGFSIGLAEAHRQKHLGLSRSLTRLSKWQKELADEWGVQIATYYLALIDGEGIFGKEADADLYGIGDRWRLLGEDERLDEFDRLKDCVERGKRAAHEWFDEAEDVPPRFLEALEAFVQANPDAVFG